MLQPSLARAIEQVSLCSSSTHATDATTQAMRAFAAVASALSGPKPGTPPAEDSTARVNVTVSCETEVGDRVGLVGDCATLGWWTPADAVWLTTDEAQYPEWRAVVELPAASTVTYKYVVASSDGRVRWEAVDNRVYTAPAPGGVIGAVVEVFGSVWGNLALGNDELQLLHHFCRNFDFWCEDHPWACVQALRCVRVLASTAPEFAGLLSVPVQRRQSTASTLAALRPALSPTVAGRQDPRHALLCELLKDTLVVVQAALGEALVRPATPPASDPYAAAFHGRIVRRVPDLAAAVNPSLGLEAPRGAACMRRLQRELRTLATDLPCSSQAAIFVAVDKRRPYIMKVAMSGPEGTPYDSGLFVFDLVLPPRYPAVPPKMTFLTTGGGQVRMSPTLYKNGRVCLSLLGTWSGPGWTSSSTILQVLVSLQSMVLGATQPYLLEPGMERLDGSPEGEYRSRVSYNGGWERIRAAVVRWAIADVAASPPPVFEDVVRTHFVLKRAHVETVLGDWMCHAEASDTPGLAHVMGAHTTAARAAMDAL